METNASVLPSAKTACIAITIIFSGFLAFAYGFGIYLFPVLSPDMRQDLAFTYAEMGYVAAGIQAGFILSSVVSGLLAPKIGELRFIFASMLFCGVCLVALSRVSTSLEAAAVLTFTGFVPAASWIPMVAVIRRYIPYERRGIVFGFLSGSGGYGAIINGQIVPVLQEDLGWRGIWMTAGCAVLLLTFACVILFRTLAIVDKREAEESNVPGAVIDETRVLNRSTLKIAIHLWAIMMLGAAITISFQTYFTALIRDYLDIGRLAAGRMTFLHGCVGLMAAPLIGFLTDKFNVRVCFIAVAIFTFISCMLMFFAETINYVALSALFFGFAFYPFFGLPPAYASKTMETGTAVRIFAVGNVFVRLGAFLGNMSGSLVLNLFGSLPAVYAWQAILTSVLMALILTIQKENGAFFNSL